VHIIRLRPAGRIGNGEAVRKDKFIRCPRAGLGLSNKPPIRLRLHVYGRRLGNLQLHSADRRRPEPKPHPPLSEQQRTVHHEQRTSGQHQEIKVFCFFSSEKKNLLFLKKKKQKNFVSCNYALLRGASG
jgi:hypothetical protein